MEAIADKTVMRRRYRERRTALVDALTEQDLRVAFSVAPSMLKTLLKPGITVAAYYAIGSEADPSRLLRSANEAGCITALPFVTSKIAPMQFLEWQPSDPLETGPFALQQPSKSNAVVIPDVILVPLIAFDRRCRRLGQGAGHYDRALSILEKTITIGIAWSVQEAEAVSADSWDVPLDHILTEKEWITP
jgi:5-formyltetrahydrofolate cyclo-ligase